MNMSWIIPGDGDPHRRDVQGEDRRELLAKGFHLFTLELKPDGEGTRTWDLYAAQPISFDDAIRALNALAGDGAFGGVRVLDANGALLSEFGH
ncbi:MAG: hypothetical protein HEQ38_18605 [Gemmatimonas sp.]|jgi:hypothetical protein|nr:hypothetical protein [Gemmatimonas sp.]